MCGISGILRHRQGAARTELFDAVASMSGAMARRGPDGSDTWIDEDDGIALGHRRLAVLDLTPTGDQPMTSASGRFVITFNGEVFNHDELRHRLGGAAPTFRGTSDTETLLGCIEAWGLVRTLDRIDAMFAFGLWDRQEKVLTLARDPLGERPLYVGALRSGDTVFASTLDGISAHPDFDLDVDIDAIAEYFAFRYVPAPRSIFAGVSKLEPGTLMTVDRAQGRSTPKRYWSIHDVVRSASPFDGDAHEAVEAVEATLLRSVTRRLKADVPTGAFMSGGIDSSTVVALAARASSEPLRTFTIGSAVADYDESDCAHRVASVFGTRHTEMIVSGDDALEALLAAPAVHDEPFGDSSNIAMTLVSRLANDDVTVALTGDGGDELFGGYNRYVWLPRIWRASRMVPGAASRSIERRADTLASGLDRVASCLVPSSVRPPLLQSKFAKAFGGMGATSQEDLYLRVCRHWSNAPLAHGVEGGAGSGTAGLPHVGDASFAERMMIADTLGLLPDEILTKADRAGMSVGLESRAPFLSRELVELAWSLPLDVKIRGGRTKWPLRQILGKSLPDSLIDRPKAGFGLPIDAWLRGPLRAWADDLLHDETTLGVVDHDVVERTWSQHLNGTRNGAYELWDVLMLADWCRRRGITLS